MDPVDGDQVYAAEQLLKARKRGGKTEYYVKWKGWGAKYNTWEPAENILDERLVADFEKRHPPRVSKPTKRASEGTAPTTPVPKRGRQSKRGADKEDTPESSSAASTSASARAARSSRRGRRGESATSEGTTDEKIDEEPAAEKEPAKKKKKPDAQKADEDKKAEAKAEAEESEEKTEEEQPAKEVSEETQEEPEEEKAAEDEPKEEDETKEEDLSLNLSDASPAESAEGPEAAPEAPLEIYVEKTVSGEHAEAGAEAAAAPAVNGDGPKEASATDNGNGDEAFVITKEDDPNCTHKIQVIRAPIDGTAAETSRDDSSDIEYLPTSTVQKKETVTETRRWTDSVDGAVSSSSDQYQYIGARTVTDVTANNTTVTILEI